MYTDIPVFINDAEFMSQTEPNQRFNDAVSDRKKQTQFRVCI